MALTAERLRDALRTVRFPGFNRDIVRLGMVADLAIEDGTVRVHLRPGTDKPEVLRRLAADVERVLGAEPGVRNVELHIARAAEGRGKDPSAEWGPTDFLVVDLPPGTGDAQLTLVQQVPVTGAVIVTTPPDVALLDVGRTMAMFAQVSTPVLGVVENMSGYVCPQCGTEDPLFGRGGADGLAERFRVPLLARIPRVPAVREGGDRGQPIVVAAPAHPVSELFRGLAERLLRAEPGRPRDRGAAAHQGAPHSPRSGIPPRLPVAVPKEVSLPAVRRRHLQPCCR